MRAVPQDRAPPTAQTSFGPAAVTSLSALYDVPGLGVSTMLHFDPSQCIASVRYGSS